MGAVGAEAVCKGRDAGKGVGGNQGGDGGGGKLLIAAAGADDPSLLPYTVVSQM